MFVLLFNPLFRLAFCMLKSRELAEEVTSDVMFKLWQKRWELLHIDNITVYALVIARNLSLNVLKQQAGKRMLSLDDVGANCVQDNSRSPEQILISSQNNDLIKQSIDALPTRCRLVFKLIKEEGLSYKEVGEILNISPKTVDAHLVTALRKLTASLKIHFYSN